jgi:hypothetical protein
MRVPHVPRLRSLRVVTPIPPTCYGASYMQNNPRSLRHAVAAVVFSHPTTDEPTPDLAADARADHRARRVRFSAPPATITSSRP